jgi:type VI secretion system protein ImpG
MFAKFYQSEIQYLREIGRLFGQANPDVAGLLSERGGDPDVERLLEGFAFLTAQIRERVEDAVPEIAAPPTCSCPTRAPSACSIVKFTGIPGGARPPAHRQGGSRQPVGGTACRFRTTMDVDLLPLGHRRRARPGGQRDRSCAPASRSPAPGTQPSSP